VSILSSKPPLVIHCGCWIWWHHGSSIRWILSAFISGHREVIEIAGRLLEMADWIRKTLRNYRLQPWSVIRERNKRCGGNADFDTSHSRYRLNIILMPTAKSLCVSVTDYRFKEKLLRYTLGEVAKEIRFTSLLRSSWISNVTLNDCHAPIWL